MKIPEWFEQRIACPRCDQVHRRCGGHVVRAGEDIPCGGAPPAGQWRCGRHATAAEKAEIVDVDAMVKEFVPIGELLKKCSVTVRGRTYIESLEDALHRANSMVMLLHMLINTLPAATDYREVVEAEGTPRETTRFIADRPGMVGPDHEGDLAVHPYMALYREWVGMQGQLSKVAADLGLTERQIEIQEVHVRIMATTLAAILGDLDIDIADPRTRGIIERHLLTMETTAIEAPNALTASATAS